MTMQVNIGGTYKDVSSAYVNVGGVWKTANNIYTNIGGVWKDASLVNYGEYELLADYIVPSNTTTVTFSGFNIGQGDEILLVSEVVNGSNTSYAIYCYANSNNSNSQYYTQYLLTNGASVSSARGNNAYFIDMDNAVSRINMSISSIKLTNSGYFIRQTQETTNLNSASLLELNNWYSTSTWSSTSISSITLTASTSGGIGTNSRFQLYKIGGAS